MTIALGSDHGGYALKQELIEYLTKRGFALKDYGCYTPERAEYPVIGETVARAVASGDCGLGIVLCGTGCGISLAANRVKGIRCSNCSEPVTARLSRQHNNCNMIALGGRIIGAEMAFAIVDAFLDSQFESGGRHEQRVAMIEAIDRK